MGGSRRPSLSQRPDGIGRLRQRPIRTHEHDGALGHTQQPFYPASTVPHLPSAVRLTQGRTHAHIFPACLHSPSPFGFFRCLSFAYASALVVAQQHLSACFSAVTRLLVRNVCVSGKCEHRLWKNSVRNTTMTNVEATSKKLTK